MASHMTAAATTGMSPPQSIEKITRRAQEYDFKPQIPLRYWLRTAATLVKEAEIYEREGNEEQAYFLLFRHAQLILVNLSNHPEAKEEKNRRALVEAEKEVNVSLAKLERLKPRIKKRHDRYTQLMRERQALRGAVEPKDGSSQLHVPAENILKGTAEPLEARANRDLAVQLARSEINRRTTARKANREASFSSEEERARRTGGVFGNWERALGRDRGADNDDLTSRIQEVRLHMDGTQTKSPQNAQPSVVHSSLATPSISAYKYPSVPRQQSSDASSFLRSSDLPSRNAVRIDPPTLPPKEQLESGTPFGPDKLPQRPDKVVPSPQLPEKVKSAEATSRTNLNLDPSSFSFKPSAQLENGTSLRTVFLPPDLRHRFLQIAAPNTRRNLETCGILCGTLISNALFISKLLIPEQISTSDTCETVNESAIFDYCDSEDLMILGWIHTHPTQTCFMSSRDLHTHCGYQVMLPESIAIVCAPSKSPDWGVFRLTDPPGLKAVLNCTQTGLFHPHSETDIYTDALRPGHVFEARGMEFETVDLRP